jgi:hypothetical protein
MGPKLTADRPAVKVWLAVDMEACAEPTAEPTKQDQSTPIKMVSGRAWSTGIYQALTRLHIPIFIPILGGQEPGAGFLFLLGFLWNPKGTFLMFLLFLRVGTLVPLRNRNPAYLHT